jgi:hypothetical protein
MNDTECAQKSNGLTITGRHGAIGMHTGGGDSRPCIQVSRIEHLIAGVEQARTDILVVDARTEKTLELVKELHARKHDADLEERVISEVEREANAKREAARVRAKDRTDLIAKVIDAMIKVGPWVALGVGWMLSHK